MSAGTYSGSIVLSASGAANVTVPVTLIVSSSNCDDSCGGSTASVTAQPYTYDPNSTGTVSAAWVNGIGTPGSGRRDQGLLLSKNGGSTPGALTGATIRNFSGSLTEIGFDYREGGQCTATSPRFIVVTSDNITHVIGGCSKGTTTAAPAVGWKRVRFNLADATQTAPVITPGEQVSSITLVMDLGPEAGASAAGGLVVIDNIDINGSFAAAGSTFNRDN
jgi:hypothetical protein